jgi:single-stranded-DNA-specific exonuclease
MHTESPAPLLERLLHARGITSPGEKEAFLNPDYDTHTSDPYLLLGMREAVGRILDAVERGEKIVIYSDYDMDGIPAAVIMYDFFHKIGYQNTEHYIPHRILEGFGMNVAAVEELAARGANLIITLDCGITDVEPVARAKELGIEVIITDHHIAHGTLPDAVAIVDPKREGDEYPFKGLCGAGVAFKLVQALLAAERDGKSVRQQYGISEGWEKWLLDMTGMATVSDRVPLIGENRMLAHFGLIVLRKSRRPGIHALCRKLGLDQRRLTEDDIGFSIAPRINAASRMGVPEDAFALLVAEDYAQADTLARHLDEINNERKGHVASMIKEIRKRLKAREVREVIVLGDPKWKPSLLGLAANTLMEEFNRPVFLWGREEGTVIKGSCRSDGSVDLVAMMSHVRDSFIECGGHAFSGGFSVETERVHLLEEALVGAYAKELEKVSDTSIESAPSMHDGELSLDAVTEDTYRELQKLAPFGEGNPKPVFLFKDIVVSSARRFGKGNDHVELKFENSVGEPVKAIQFFSNLDPKNLAASTHVNVLGSIEKSYFRSATELRLRIVNASKS